MPVLTALIVRARGASVAVSAFVHAVIVTWFAWYLADEAWAAATTSASPTPLPFRVFLWPWIAGCLVLLVSGVTAGTLAARGPWEGSDPMRALPVSTASRLASAWTASLLCVAIIALAPMPVYVCLWQLGAFTAASLAPVAAITIGVLATSTLSGVWLSSVHSQRQWAL
jgi:hypothetical protein